MEQVFRGSVNSWECDENNHLNVRFYAHKMYQSLQTGLRQTGLINEDTIDITPLIRSVHMRYIAEARIAVPLTGYFGVVEQSTEEMTVLTELRNTANHEVMASYVFELALHSDTKAMIMDMPQHAGSRGLPAETSPFIDLSLSEAITKGFQITGQGVIQAEECDTSNHLLFYQYIGRVSDSVPNLWVTQGGESTRGDGIRGGAVLEYRTDLRGHLSLGNGFKLVTGLTGLGNKTKQLVHLLYNQKTSECVAASSVIAINMDLVARKAMAIPDHEREVMEKILVQPD